jgi:thymidylate synthase (FAD)
MHNVEPKAFLISRPTVDYSEVRWAIEDMAGRESVQAQQFRWNDTTPGDEDKHEGQDLIEVGGRLCYKSWKPGVNKNVSRVRENQAEYLQNILKSGHGSVLEHANYSFLFTNVSRVFTHELVRHRAGSAFSQESLRFVRLDDLGINVPEEYKNDPFLEEQLEDFITQSEQLQADLATHFELDKPGKSFHEKKEATSFMRRFAPEGLATHIMWTANVRTLRHTIEARTSQGAEQEIRRVFGQVAGTMIEEAPALFGDFAKLPNGSYVPEWSKV